MVPYLEMKIRKLSTGKHIDIGPQTLQTLKGLLVFPQPRWMTTAPMWAESWFRKTDPNRETLSSAWGQVVCHNPPVPLGQRTAGCPAMSPSPGSPIKQNNSYFAPNCFLTACSEHKQFKCFFQCCHQLCHHYPYTVVARESLHKHQGDDLMTCRFFS